MTTTILRPGMLLLALLLTVLLSGGSFARDTVEPQPGMLLVADRRLRDPRFRESVVLLVDVGPGGAAGVIINKPTATKVFRLFDVTKGFGRGTDPIYYGGPVGGHEVLMLRRSDRASEGWAVVLDHVIVTNNRMAMLDALLTSRKDEDIRVFAGYAGWARGQLEWEIRRGGWHLFSADAATIFRRDVNRMWPELDRKSREILL